MDAHEVVFADASALIYLAKADGFSEAHSIFGPIAVTPAVWREAVETGEIKGYLDVSKIRSAAEDGLLHRLQVSGAEERRAQELARSSRLGQGECQILVIARPDQEVLMDDVQATQLALFLKLRPIPTVMVPWVGVQRGVMSSTEGLVLLHRLGPASAVRADLLIAIERALKGMA